jgi:hypothetical protein
MLARWWTFSTLVVFAYLAFSSWVFYQEEAYAASGFTEFRTVKKKKSRRKRSRSKVPYRKISRVEGGYSVTYGFRNFNKDVLRMRARFTSAAVAASIKEFGFKKKDFDNLDFWYQIAQENAIAKANKRMRVRGANSRRIQAQLDRQMEQLAQEYRNRRLKIYRAAGFRYQKEGVVEVDIPALVRRSKRRVLPVARSFGRIAKKKGYDADDLVGAATAWVQTSLTYEIPATREGTRTVAGVLPPLKALVLGQGDCDTKSALLASVLKNWPKLKMVGLGIPGHYLMAIHRIPRRGDVFIEHKGLSYVMIESAGPAWIPPGQVGDQTMAYLNGGNNFRIQAL